MKGSDEKNYDIIIIGSGMGALATASIMAQFRNKRVLMLERHYVMGGFTHEFGRKRKYSWDVGIHYVGDMYEGAMLRRLFDIVTKSSVKWKAMPEVFEKFVYPDFTFEVPFSEEEYKGKIIAMFPDEKEAIERYFEDVYKVNQWFGRHNMKSSEPYVDKIRAGIQIQGFDTADITTGQYMKKNFQSEKLRALLCSQWGDYGIPPAQSSFVIHCSVACHYFKGGYYPVGGAGQIAESIKPIIEEHGGCVLLSHEVEEILVRDGKACGVRVKNLVPRKEDEPVTEYYAPVVISNAGAYTTYNRLLDPSIQVPFRKSLNDFYANHPVVTSVTLYLGLSKDPREMGFYGENHWIYSSYDHDANFAAGQSWVGDKKDILGAYLSFPSLKNPEAQTHTAEIIGLTDFSSFEKWDATSWKKRGDDYEGLKEEITTKLLGFIDSHYPGFSNMIEYQELSTPLSVKHFTGHPSGSIYGVPAVRERFLSSEAPFCQANTPVEGLYLTGADVSSPGIAGALMGAMATVGVIPEGISFIRLLKAANEAVPA
ncbi:MAG: NAD(P)/FAD-dependent oxidoreductase [Leptospiraceae bacterium]|nr:NAD(P)/FAD-dependent oxidoreductase [Leptospiraceae bacterium]